MAGAMTTTRVPAGPDDIATVRIDLVGSDPPIWRQIEAPTSTTLLTLHRIIQVAMGWQEYHMWEFVVGNQRYGIAGDADDWGAPPTIDAGKVRLSELLRPRKTIIDYTYDFGDDWEHRLTITDIRPGEAGGAYPRYVTGERPAPPEDSAGVPGFYDKLEILADPRHPEHKEIAEWLGGYDPEVLNELPIRYGIGRIAARRNAAKGPRGKCAANAANG